MKSKLYADTWKTKLNQETVFVFVLSTCKLELIIGNQPLTKWTVFYISKCWHVFCWYLENKI